MKITKNQIAKNTSSNRISGNSFNYGYETSNFLFTTSDQRVLVENKNVDGIAKQYGDAVTKKEFVNNVYEFLTEVENENIEAGNHFLDLYEDELKEVTADTVQEWWVNTKDQYRNAIYESVERQIMNKI